MSYESIDDNHHEFDERLTPQPPQLSDAARRGWLLNFFVFVSGVTALTALLTVTFLGTFMITSFSKKGLNADALRHLIIQLYDVVLCIAVVVIEMEWTDAIHKLSLLQSWFIRGLCYCFVGLIIYQELGDFNPQSLAIHHRTYLQLPSALLIVLGIIYSLMGLLCLKKVRDSKMARYIQLLSHFEVSNV
jgi:hypothetical protein